jgi:hypothetical protein
MSSTLPNPSFSRMVTLVDLGSTTGAFVWNTRNALIGRLVIADGLRPIRDSALYLSIAIEDLQIELIPDKSSESGSPTRA